VFNKFSPKKLNSPTTPPGNVLRMPIPQITHMVLAPAVKRPSRGQQH